MTKPIINVADARGGTVVTPGRLKVSSERRGLWLTYLPHHLDEDGEIKGEPGIDRTFVEFTTAVVAMATRAAAGKRPGRVACRAHGKPVTCPGEIETEIAQLPRRIEWWCSVCGNSGSIFGWEWTRWNRSKMVRRTALERKRAGAAATKSAGSKLARKKASQVA